MEENIKQAIEQALSEAPERKFVESIEFAFTIKDVDLKNPNNRIQEEIRLPAGRGREPSIAMFADGEMAAKAKDAGIVVIDPTKIEELGGTRQKHETSQRNMTSSFLKSHTWDLLVDSSVLFSVHVGRCRGLYHRSPTLVQSLLG